MKRYVVVLFSFILLLNIIINPLVTQAEVSTSNNDIALKMKEDGMDLVSENESLIFYMNDKTAEFAIVSKHTGNDIWYSNPKEAEEDALATLENKRKLQSQLSVRYLNDKVQEGIMNSHTDAVLENQFVIEEIENGVRVTYTLGKEVAGSMIPKIISIERMDDFLSKMAEKDKKMVLSLYKEEVENNTYLLRTKAPSFKQQEAAELFLEIGYTIEDYTKDLEDNGVEEEGGAVFTIPVEYTISGESFLASIDRSKVINVGKSTLTDIKLLEYFGAGSSTEDGYLFVPDGSGALINFNNGKITASPYLAKVYGVDETLTYNRKTTGSKDIEVRMPVFGIKNGDKAMLAVISEGASHASIYGDVAGAIHSYNYVYPEFNAVPNGKSALESMTGNGSLQLYQKENYKGKYKVEYSFLSEKDADYSGMARYYQQYLEKTGALTRTEQNEDIPFYMEVLGGINVKKSFLGIPYEGIEVLSTYSDAQKMINQVKSNDVNNLKVIMNGWFNGGVNHTYPSKIKEIKELNDKEYNRRKFIEYTDKEEVDLFFDVDFQYVYQDNTFDGFSKNSKATRYFDNTIASIGGKGMDRAERALFQDKYILNTTYVQDSIKDFLKSDKKNSISNLSLRTITDKVSADFTLKNPVDRQESVEHYRSSLEYLTEQNIGLLGRNASQYSFDYLSDIVEIPTHSNEYTILDETIPFYQMVLHGYIEYAAKSLNLEADLETEYLKAIESGAGLYFTWIYEKNHKLKDTAFGNYFSVNFDSWYDEAMEKYKSMNAELKQTQNQRITKHEKIQEKVYKTTYENGIVTYVNYSDTEVVIDNGQRVGSKDFYVKGVK